ncbi:hypothetical protein HN587_01290 [Candidatus Woesearchaeota archaeon]|jgi:hypothetical protein|nr:hypothetical protein [Candidatus Woesearchaeota archaeon]
MVIPKIFKKNSSSLIFDSGPIISFATTNLLWLVEELKKMYPGKFYITDSVKRELIDYPLKTKKFKFEALQVQYLLRNEVLDEIESDEIHRLGKELAQIANTTFKAKGNYLKLFHCAEMDVVAAAIILKSDAIVVDERATRVILEDPKKLRAHLEKQMKSPVSINQESLSKFKDLTESVRVLRSIELAMVGYEKGILDKFLLRRPDASRLLVESVLWGMKLNGCAISRREIDELIKLEQKPTS